MAERKGEGIKFQDNNDNVDNVITTEEKEDALRMQEKRMTMAVKR